MLKTSLIIPTYNRPEALSDCIDSVLKQTVLPDELIIVDDGNLEEIPYEKACQNKGIHTIYYKKDTPGLTRSRNKGVELSSGDIILFLDDDVILFPDYIEQILAGYDENTSGVGGLVEIELPKTFKNSIRRIFEIIFLISGMEEGKVLPSGFCTNYSTTNRPIKELKKVDFLDGGVMSVRSEVFEEFSFNEKYNRCGMGEDKDFSYRVAQRYNVKINPKARLYHMNSIIMSPNDVDVERMFIIAQHLFFINYIKKGWWSWLFFYYALFGYTLLKIINLIFYFKKKTLLQLKGIFKGYKDIISGNTLILTGRDLNKK